MTRNNSLVDITERPLRVALYGRVSSEDQAEKGTIETQQVRLRAFVEAQGYMVTPGGEYWDNGVTGTLALKDREAGAALLWAAGTTPRSFDHVLVYKLDRLGRSAKVMLEAFEALKKLGVSIRSITEPFDTSNPVGEFVFQLLGSVSQLERSSILERTAAGRMRAKANGKYLGSRAPYGYGFDSFGCLILDTLPIEGLKQLPQGLEMTPVEVVRLMFSQAAGGLPVMKIAEWLQEKGIPARNNTSKGLPMERAAWCRRTVADMLGSVTYKGKGRGDGTWLVPPIVPEELWDAVQRARNATPYKARGALPDKGYILQGLIKCCLCGRVYCAWENNKKARHTYYRCGGAMGSLMCKNRSQGKAALEERIWNKVVEDLRDVDRLVRDTRAALEAKDLGMEALREEYATVSTLEKDLVLQRDRQLSLFRTGRVTEAENELFLDALELQLATLRHTLYKIERKLPQNLTHPNIHASTVDVLTAVAKRIVGVIDGIVLEDWDTFRRRTLQEVLHHVVLDARDPKHSTIELVWRVWEEGSGSRVASGL